MEQVIMQLAAALAGSAGFALLFNARGEKLIWASLGGLLSWLANNPPQRASHETADRAAAARAFRQFTPSQIAAVVNIAWGGRTSRRETSLLAAFLINPDFRPSDSPTHARALLHYRRALRSQQVLETPPERMAA